MIKTMWITKYALLKGIYQDEGLTSGEWFGPSDLWLSCKIGRDCFDTYPEAVARAEQMRVEHIASLRRSIAKLEKLTFPAKVPTDA